ncbi:hypothetical protein N9M50_06780 [Alphaproteobacteria bacterium]|nr:hypothetical protein [Alphaproteobacteria bacterium]
MSNPDPRLTCTACRHLFVTHDRHRPWGCSYFGFKSPNLPGQTVFSSSGTKCANYEKRIAKKTSANQQDKGILA